MKFKQFDAKVIKKKIEYLTRSFNVAVSKVDSLGLDADAQASISAILQTQYNKKQSKIINGDEDKQTEIPPVELPEDVNYQRPMTEATDQEAPEKKTLVEKKNEA